MALKKCLVLLGQSNQEGVASKLDLPAALRGAQANTFVWNHENNARETLNCDGAGANLPNNNTAHTANLVGPEMSLCAAAVAALGEIDLFKFATASTCLGPQAILRSWNVDDEDLFGEFKTRWNAYIVVMTGLGHTVQVELVSWLQGETDSAIEGHDEAYYGLFKRFIKEVRAFLAPYTAAGTTLRWITNLIHNGIVPPGFTYILPRVQNIRGAQRKAGWSDPSYRIVDTDVFSHTGDPLHLDTAGVVACGEADWAAHLLTYNNSMAFEEYDLGSLRARLAEEFGIDTTLATNNSILDKRINDAVSWIVNRRKNWPWLEREVSLDVGERSTSATDTRYGSGIFSIAQAQVLNCTFSQTAIAPREIVDFEGRGHDGLMALSLVGSTMQLRHGYRGDVQICTITGITIGTNAIVTINLATSQGGTATIPANVSSFVVVIAGTSFGVGGAINGTYTVTRLDATRFTTTINTTGFSAPTYGTAQVAREFAIAQGYFELPEDFIRSNAAHLADDAVENTLIFRHPTLFEREIRSSRLITTLKRIYTAMVDPLNLSSRKYLAVYPYFTDRDLIHLKYYGDTKKLIADGDVPDVPRSDRFVVLYAASWFVAQWQKEVELIAFYRDGALNELERMTKEYQLADDTTEFVRMSDESLPGIPQSDGFPEFETR